MELTELSQLTDLLRQKSDLDREQIRNSIDLLVNEETGRDQKVDFLETLARKGETVRELTEFVSYFRELSLDPELKEFAPHAIDLCGTGGDKAGSFNVSTFVSFVLASAGVPVIKHGNRSISSKCGSADLLEAIGVPLGPELKVLQEGLERLNFAFLFAPSFHPAFKHIAPVRKELASRGIITIFNLLGPMINPARPAFQVLGVYDPKYLEKIGQALKGNHLTGATIVHGTVQDSNVSGVDEITACGENLLFGFGRVPTENVERWSPAKWGMKTYPFEHLCGGDLSENLAIMKRLLEGQGPEGLRATVAMNASVAFLTCGKTKSLEEGIELTESLISDGKVKAWISEVSSFFKK
jgi:anthranilate phosphoribosyltransferase